ncbi:hypothetical protein EVAR_62441_1 [Eumeta japonica]|uniref:Uncharacterized protein n=1 Tax=Eumeta variegata TaxID=151549 RepID=A0A4C1Z9U8_EUMVA|nr:hypothetical protein EVAR_62441_1 [Eumeta japonica]
MQRVVSKLKPGGYRSRRTQNSPQLVARGCQQSEDPRYIELRDEDERAEDYTVKDEDWGEEKMRRIVLKISTR